MRCRVLLDDRRGLAGCRVEVLPRQQWQGRHHGEARGLEPPGTEQQHGDEGEERGDRVRPGEIEIAGDAQHRRGGEAERGRGQHEDQPQHRGAEKSHAHEAWPWTSTPCHSIPRPTSKTLRRAGAETSGRRLFSKLRNSTDAVAA